mgnify:FL=1
MKKAVLYYIIFSGLFFTTILSQDLRENITRSLFSDNKATRPGDAITILVLEVNSATNGATTSTQRTSDLSLSANGSATGIGNVPAFDANFGLGTNNSFTGGGSVSSRGDVRARISATVDSIYSNGNLHIIVRRTISIAGEDQIIDISGIVRPSDIQADNSVLSSNISDAVISFSGSGMVERSQEPGWLTKIFHWIF